MGKTNNNSCKKPWGVNYTRLGYRWCCRDFINNWKALVGLLYEKISLQIKPIPKKKGYKPFN